MLKAFECPVTVSGNHLTEKEIEMKKVFAVIVLFATTAAFASCPTYAPYRCVVQMNGKQLCGCGM
jgi:hypothetical protein